MPSYPTLLGAALVGAIVASELAHRNERAEKPVLPGKHHLAYEQYEPASPPDHLVVFVHGWPDDMAIFKELARKLALAGYLSVTCNLPGYPVPPQFRGVQSTIPSRKWGFSFEESVQALKTTIDELQAAGAPKKLTLVTHDWGCVVGYLYDQAFPNSVHRMVSMDVGWRLAGKRFLNMVFTLLYQGILNICFMLPQPLGTVATKILSVLFGRRASAAAGPVTSRMNWPYRAAWRETFTKGTISRLDQYRVTPIPRLFLYAKETPPDLRFADEQWYQAIENSYKGISKNVAVSGGHWMMVRNASALNQIVVDWMRLSDAST